MKLPLICLLCMAGIVLSAEPVKFPLELGSLTTVGAGSRTFDGVKVVSSDAIGIKIMHEGGTSRIAYDKLPPELRQRFAVDPEAAKEQLRKEAEQNAAHDRAVGDGMQTPGADGGKTPLPDMAKPQVPGQADENSDEAFLNRILGEDKPDATGRTKAEKIVLMKGYVAHLKQQIAKLDEDLKKREERASRSSTRSSNRGSGVGKLGELGAHHEKYHEARKQIHDKLKDAEKDLFDLESGN
ncbi:hypothetical protein OVA24_04425 [Luteolibacter sp. SL250]|uniref:hypothetical protein n=1 Tax=Luteolibacter sp. SL250 TaxID=2995170 RepID=UPI00226F3BC8|nr:hypothetical protein [Luteolibacter sp. SL250]WAC20624.1 hypothetical protein OVA24_04425 [Luteolibacter sp. SL250]